MNKIILPDLGEGISNATVALWHVKEGDRVGPDDDVVEIVSDKASFNVQARCSGIIQRIVAREGQEVRVGDPLAFLEGTKS